MITSKFSKAVLPLALATIVTGGCLVKSVSENKESDKKEITLENTTSNPLNSPALMGTLFTLGLLGTVGAGLLANAVDLRYKDSKEKIEEIYDIATVTEQDYEQAYKETCEELNNKGQIYDKEELRLQFSPKSKEELINMINENITQLKRVTANCKQDKKAAANLYYLIQELKSAVEYGKIPKNDDIKYKMQYQFDKATMPKKQWKEAELRYKSEHPNIDFDEEVGVEYEGKWKHLTKVAVYDFLEDKEIIIDNPQDLLKPLREIIKNLNEQPKLLNKYDREECLKLANEAVNDLESFNTLPSGLFQKILEIYICRQQTHV